MNDVLADHEDENINECYETSPSFSNIDKENQEMPRDLSIEYPPREYDPAEHDMRPDIIHDAVLSHTSLRSLRGRSRCLPASRLLSSSHTDCLASAPSPHLQHHHHQHHSDVFSASVAASVFGLHTTPYMREKCYCFTTNTRREPMAQLLLEDKRKREAAGELFQDNYDNSPLADGDYATTITDESSSNNNDQFSQLMDYYTDTSIDNISDIKSETIDPKTVQIFSELNSNKTQEVIWSWDDRFLEFPRGIKICNDNRDCMFVYEIFENDVASPIQGNVLLQSGGQHFWEIEILDPIHRYDLWIGISTKVTLADLPIDNEMYKVGGHDGSYGFSRRGQILHNNNPLNVRYCDYNKGCIIGVYLDLWQGTLDFFKNRVHIGVRYNGIDCKKQFYPSISATQSDTSVRILKTVSLDTSLKFLCCKVLRKCVPSELQVSKELDLPVSLRPYVDDATSMIAHDCEFDSVPS